MTRLSDVNARDIRGAIRLGCETMSRAFNADDGDMPFFSARVRPVAEMRDTNGPEAHVPGRHLNALLNAEDAAGIVIDERAVEKHAHAAFFSYGGPVRLPLRRDRIGGELKEFSPHDVREGFHALYSLATFRGSERARELFEQSVAEVLAYWDYDSGWAYHKLESDHGLQVQRERSFISGLARSIGPLVKYYRARQYGPALELAIVLKEKALDSAFYADGSFDAERFGSHNHSTTCVMSSLAQLADVSTDSTLLHRVKAFYDNGMWELRDELGWSIETSDPEDTSARGEANNTGDILETALILGRWGYPDYYHDAERILRCHLLPSQLRDVSFIVEPPNPEGIDGRRDIPTRLRGAFGLPAPYGHEPVNIMSSGKPRIGFNLDIVGGAVGSLCEAFREATSHDVAGHRINLLFDHETPWLEVESAYTHPTFAVRVKKPGPLFVRVPPWTTVDSQRVQGAGDSIRQTNSYVFVSQPPVNRKITIEFTLSSQEITLNNPDGPIRVRLRGDEVVGMDDLDADLTFFDPIT